MKIGIDIDGVLTNDDDFILEYATKFCYENNIDFYKNPYLWETRKFNWSEDILQKYRDKFFWEYVNNEPPRKFASEVINKLKQEGNEIYIITSRHLTTSNDENGEKMRNAILKWLEKYNIPYDEIYFSKDKTIEINELKLDLSCFNHISNNEQTQKIISTILDLSQKLKLPLIAEGVETEEQFNFLKKAGCKNFQGYFLEKPIDIMHFERKYFN